ncbi:MAG: hypothetical protein HRT58_05595 [Crocinitomicaceae bacterium]|nr:hypothetical protein [Flavobacteriales bacterium]NQZ35114.1 hypothetical protein [Crocinitomicaceae bacterium]
MKNILILASILVVSSCVKQETNPTTEPPGLLSQYTLENTNNIGVPVSNPTGIASDGTNLWIMSGEHNGDQHELTLYDPLSNTILEQYMYANLIEVLGTGVYGVTWDGKYVWISVSGNTNKLVKVDPHTGDILQTWSSPTSLGPSDLEWDGDKIWISSGTGQIYSMNISNGGSQQLLDNVGHSSRDSGIAFRNDELWVGNLFNTNVLIYSALDGAYHGVIKNALSSKGKFCFHNGQLAVLSSGGIVFYDVIG